MDTQSVSTRTITVAGGRYAPGHLGELTQHCPFEMVDEALTATKTTQARLRDLPARVVIYLLLAACLFPEVGYPGVWRKLTAGLTGIPVATPTTGALRQARSRVGIAPLRWLFDLLRGPAATRDGRGTWWRGLLICAIDGTTLTVPDTPRILTRFTKQRGHHGGAGYPQIRLLALVACGTRTLIDAVFGPTTGETTYTPLLQRSLRAGMILLADRNFGAKDLLTDIAATGAHVLVRLKNGRKIPVLARYSDGSYLSMLGALPVRIVECEITITTTAGRHTGVDRLATTLLHHHRYPAAELVTLYHQRWEIETAYLELKSSILGGRVLRAAPQTVSPRRSTRCWWSTNCSAPSWLTRPTPASTPIPTGPVFSVAWQAVRDQLVLAANVIAGAVVDLVGTIGAQVLANLLPARRLRICPRIVKRAISKHQARGPNIDRTSYKATVGIDILAPPPVLTTTTNAY